MPGYEFSVTMSLENAGTKEQVVSIPRGTLIEPESTKMSFQSAVVNKDYLFTLDPGEVRSVLLEVECWNRHLSPPEGVPGKLTPFKGSIQKTTDIWKTSSSPAPGTVLYSASQDGHIFSAMATANPDLAREYLLGIADVAASTGHNVTTLRHKIQNTVSGSHASQPQQLRELSKTSALAQMVNATTIREFLIRRGVGVGDLRTIDCLIEIATNLHALNGLNLTSKLYEVALELKDLKDDLETTIVSQDKEELLRVVRRKAIDLLDSLPLIDRSKPSAMARA
jgi:hypothetical protein